MRPNRHESSDRYQCPYLRRPECRRHAVSGVCESGILTLQPGLLTEFLHNASGDLTNIVYYVAVIIHTLEEREKWKKEQEAGRIYDKLLPSSW